MQRHAISLVERSQARHDSLLALRRFKPNFRNDGLVEILHHAQVPNFLHGTNSRLKQVGASQDRLIERRWVVDYLGLLAGLGIRARLHSVGAQHLGVGIQRLNLGHKVDCAQALIAILGNLGR